MIGETSLRRGIRSGAAQPDAEVARQLAVAGGQCLRFASREESRVEATVVAHARSAGSQVHDFDDVRMALIGAGTVVVVASVRGTHRACGHFADSAHRSMVHRRPLTSLVQFLGIPAVWSAGNLSLHWTPRA